MSRLLKALMLNEALFAPSVTGVVFARQAARAAARPAPAEVEEEPEAEGAEGDGPLGIVEFDESLDDVQKPPEVPAGRYPCEVQDIQEKVSKGGNTYYARTIHIAQEDLPANVRDGFPEGARMTDNRLLKPRPGDRRDLWNMKVWLQALGLDTATTRIDPNEWMGAQTRVRVVMGQYEGKPRAEIRGFEPMDAPAPAAARRPVARGAKR